MNRPPPQNGKGKPRPESPWPQRRSASDDPTSLARPLPRTEYHAPPHPSRPPEVKPPQRPQDTPWYLQRPNRPAPLSPPHGEQQQPAAVEKLVESTDFKKFLPWLLLGTGGVAVVIAAVVLIGNMSRLGMTGGTELDVTKVQDGVLQIVSDPASGYGANAVTDVSCNGGRNPSARQGTRFTCNATVNGAARHIAVLVSDDHGTYEIDSPR